MAIRHPFPTFGIANCSCALDDFFTDRYNYSVRFTNPTDVDGVSPDDVKQVDNDNTFRKLSDLEATGIEPQCHIVAVEIDEAL